MALIKQARQLDLTLAVATSTSPSNAGALCQSFFAQYPAEVFDVTAAGDKVAAKKPAPDTYHLALERLGLGPVNRLAIEDPLNGFNAAHSVRPFCVVSPSAYTITEDHNGSDLLFPSFEQMKLEELQEAVRKKPTLFVGGVPAIQT